MLYTRLLAWAPHGLYQALRCFSATAQRAATFRFGRRRYREHKGLRNNAVHVCKQLSRMDPSGPLVCGQRLHEPCERSADTMKITKAPNEPHRQYAALPYRITDEVEVLEVTVTPVGDPGTVAGVAGADAAEATLLPTEFVAVTVKV